MQWTPFAVLIPRMDWAKMLMLLEGRLGLKIDLNFERDIKRSHYK